MQLVLERGSIDKLLTFDVGLIQLSFHTSVFVHLMHAKVFSIQMLQYFNPNVTIFQSNCAEGLHFGAFHYKTVYVLYPH